MSRILYDFGCTSCGHEFEELTSMDTRVIECPECKSLTATRHVATPTLDPKMGVSNDFPTAASKWAKTRRKHQPHVERLQRDHGDIR